jgi:hypothetical protein
MEHLVCVVREEVQYWQCLGIVIKLRIYQALPTAYMLVAAYS